MSDAAAPAVAVLEPAGAVSSRAAVQFEKDVLQTLTKGSRSFVIDFAKVDLFTSAGIRVLVMLRQRLQAKRGQLVLCGMSPHVKLVFEVAGLTSQFVIVNDRAEAMIRAAVAPAPLPVVEEAAEAEPEPPVAVAVPEAAAREAAAPAAAGVAASAPVVEAALTLAAAVRHALESAGVTLPPASGPSAPPSALTASVRTELDRLSRTGR